MRQNALVSFVALAYGLGFGLSTASAQTSSSTVVPMPEDGGPLRRAPMPEGGVDDGMKRRTPQGGTDDGMKRSSPDTHCHTHTHEGTTHEHCHDHAADAEVEDHAHDEHCHGHEHDGTAHEHCHEHPGNDGAHTHADGAGLHPASTGDVKEERDEGRFGVDESRLGSGGLSAEAGGVTFTWNGYIRVLGEIIENDNQYIGRNDGFKLGNARFGMAARKGDLMAYIALEAAFGERESFNQPNATFTVRPRDAFLRYDLSRYAQVSAGRFKAPFDLGELEITALREFIDQSVESRGVLPTQGNETDGLSQDRQLGVMIHRDRLGLTADGFDVGYALALTNGRTLNLAFNDNDRPAAFGRVSAFYGSYVQLNVAGFTDSRTLGDLPNITDEEVKGTEISLLAAFAGFSIQGQVLFQNRLFESTGQPDQNSLGGHAQWTYSLWSAWCGYRFSFLDPNTRDDQDNDQVIEHTIALGYQATTLPVRFMLNGTLAQEQAKVDNNRLTLLVQYIF